MKMKAMKLFILSVWPDNKLFMYQVQIQLPVHGLWLGTPHLIVLKEQRIIKTFITANDANLWEQ